MLNKNLGFISVMGAVMLTLGACQHLPEQHQGVSSQLLATPAMAEASQQNARMNFKTLPQYTGQDPVIALVLGSGGARGYAHIGVIEVLEQNGIRPDFIVGTSAGSIVGSIYASGKSAHELRQIALNMKANDVRDIKLDMKGFFDGKKVENYVNTQVNQLPLEQLPIPMYVVATELKQGKKVVFNAGNTGQAVRASVSIPSMFIPTRIADAEYVDGGLVSPVPVNVARELGADIVIAVDILAQPMYTETTHVWGLFNQNINIMQKHLAQEELKHADIVIQPDLREKAYIFDVQGREATMQAGVVAAYGKLGQISQVYQHKGYADGHRIQTYNLQQNTVEIHSGR